MKFFETKTSSQTVFQGRVFDISVDQVELENGMQVEREVVHHFGGVGIALEDENGKFYLVKQFRYGQQKELIEFPAGKKEVGEDSLSTAKREIQEEVGYTGKDFVHLGQMVPSGAYLSEVIDMYYAKADSYVGCHFDEDERLEIFTKSLDEIEEMILNHEIIDGKTIAMVHLINLYRKKEIIK